MLKGVTYVGEVQKGDVMDGPRKQLCGEDGQYSMEDVSLIVMYGDASLEGPMQFTQGLFQSVVTNVCMKHSQSSFFLLSKHRKTKCFLMDPCDRVALLEGESLM